MTAYYNEIDPFAAAWLRELIKAGLIAPGEVDERSIEDVLPTDLAGFVQCHFFAGIGVWSYALRRAGWPDDRPVWTGSCPCQPFSAAGKGNGFADERHLWPAFFHLISQCRPITVFGEQVASKDGLAWIDLVQSDLENAGYACGAVDTCAAGFGAPHIRQRLYWAADALGQGLADALPAGRPTRGAEPGDRPSARDGGLVGLADDESCRRPGRARLRDQGEAEQRRVIVTDDSAINRLANPECKQEHEEQQRLQGDEREREADGLGGCNALSGLANAVTVGCQQTGECFPSARSNGPAGNGAISRLGNSISARLEGHAGDVYREAGWPIKNRSATETGGFSELDNGRRPGPTNGKWRDVDWLFCRDGKWRAVEPGSFPLAHGVTNRVGRLRGYGNAIVAAQAKEFIKAYMATRNAAV